MLIQKLTLSAHAEEGERAPNSLRNCMKFKFGFLACVQTHIQRGNFGGSRGWAVGSLTGSFRPYPLDHRTPHGGWGCLG